MTYLPGRVVLWIVRDWVTVTYLPGRVVLWIVRDMVGGVCITVLASEKKNFLHVHSRLSNIVQSIYVRIKPDASVKL